MAVLVGVPNKDAVFMTKPINLLNERTLKGTFFGNYKPRTDLPSVVDMYMSKVTSVSTAIPIFVFNTLLKTRLCFAYFSNRNWKWTSLLPTDFLSQTSIKPSTTW